MARRVMHSGPVYIYGENTTSYLQATCHGSTQPAKLELFTNGTMTKKLLDILFTEVAQVETVNKKSKRLISVTTHKNIILTFYVKSQTEHIKWMEYCRLLNIIPAYFIPDPSRYSTLPVGFYSKEISIDKHNAERAWVAYIIDEGVGHTLGCTGFHIITIGNNSTLNILDYHTEAIQVTWAQSRIRRYGCFESLVFVEAGRCCQGGPGMLWMHCPGFALECRQWLKSFLFDKAKRSHSTSMSIREGGKSVSIDSCVGDELSDSINRDEQTSPFSSQVSTSQRDHKKYQEEDWFASVPVSKPPVTPRKSKPPIRPRTTRKISSQSSEEGDCMKDPTGFQCAGDVFLPSSEPVARSRSNAADEAQKNDRYRKRLKTHEMVVLKEKTQTRTTSLTIDPLHSVDSIGEEVLIGCAVHLHDKLDITSLQPHLSSQHLLTRNDTDVLTNVTTTSYCKINYLLKELPRKDKGWFDKFLTCLHNSSEGNGHAGLVEELKRKFEEMSRTGLPHDRLKMTEENYEPYQVYLEVPNESSPYTFTVMPTDLVESLMQRIGRKLNINNCDIILKVAGSRRLDSSRSLMESKVCRDSHLSMVA